MSWKEETAMSNKKKFISAIEEKKTTFSALCKEFNISRECGYKWLRRYKENGEEGLKEKSRKPHSSPLKTSNEIELRILEVRDAHPAWGARKIYAFLARRGIDSLPDPSTITRILHRQNRIHEEASLKRKAFIRFEHSLPNQLWQMDFKGSFEIDSGRCNPLTILDDHSRYSICLRACENQQKDTVKTALINAFRIYGLPERMTMDNGSPWGNPGDTSGHTNLEVWLIRLGIYVSHSRPFHPQTQGKDERFHRSLQEELLNGKKFRDLEDVQNHFNEWRWCYNQDRPHEALGMHPPSSKYKISFRVYPEHLPEIEYSTGSELRKVEMKGDISYRGKRYFISESMRGLFVRLVESERNGIIEVYLAHQKVKEIDWINKIAAKKIV